MLSNHGAFESLLLITVLAVLVPAAVRALRHWIRLPIVVAEILAGILVGHSGFNLLQESVVIEFLSNFGFIFLMFLSGLETDFRALSGTISKLNGDQTRLRFGHLAGINFGLTLLCGIGIGWLLQGVGLTSNPVLMGLILSTTSLGVVVPVLKERDLAGRNYGQLLLASALLSDFITLWLLGLAVTIIGQGPRVDLLLFLVLLVAFVLASKVVRWARHLPPIQWLVRDMSHATAQIRVRWAFALIVFWVALASSLEVEVILGAFLAGAIVSQTRSPATHVFQEKLDAIGYGFFIPIFFIMVGARFDLRALAGSDRALLLVPLLILAAYLVKILPALSFRMVFPWRETLAGGFLLASRLSLLVAASAIAVDRGLIDQATNAGIILVAVVTCTLSPVLFNRILPASHGAKREGVIILGTDSLAELLGRRLLHSQEPVTFIGRDRSRLKKLREIGCRVVIGPPEDESVLAEAGADQARALVALSNDVAVLEQACRIARQRFEIPTLVARADDPEAVKRLQAIPAQVVQPAVAMALGLEGALHFPESFTALLDKSNEFDLTEARLNNPELIDRPLRQVQLPGQPVVLGIRRHGEEEVRVPHADTIVHQGDILTLCGSPEALWEARQSIESVHPARSKPQA